jgi:RimJ/RimL family protein N-acetyltransferase
MISSYGGFLTYQRQLGRERPSRGAPRVVLSTAARNARAQRLFASAGFRDTMIEMTRELDEPDVE